MHVSCSCFLCVPSGWFSGALVSKLWSFGDSMLWFWHCSFVFCLQLLRHTLLHLGESHRPLTPIRLKSTAIHLPFLSRRFCKSMPPSWLKVVYTPPKCITMRLPFVSRCFCKRIRIRGRWPMRAPQKNEIYFRNWGRPIASNKGQILIWHLTKSTIAAKIITKKLFTKIIFRGNSFCNYYKNTLHSARKS